MLVANIRELEVHLYAGITAFADTCFGFPENREMLLLKKGYALYPRASLRPGEEADR